MSLNMFDWKDVGIFPFVFYCFLQGTQSSNIPFCPHSCHICVVGRWMKDFSGVSVSVILGQHQHGREPDSRLLVLDVEY